MCYTFENEVKLACREAQKSPHTHKHGCVIMDHRGKVLASGYNHWAPHSTIDKYLEKIRCDTEIEGYAFHAEVSTYFQIPKRFRKDLILLVIRVKGDCLRNSKPCKKCQTFLRNKNIRVYYSDENGIIRRG
jgi:hypothetical protein